MNKGTLGTWFRPNPFGGYCGFLIMIGVDADHPGDGGKVTIIRQFDGARKMYAFTAVVSIFFYYLS